MAVAQETLAQRPTGEFPFAERRGGYFLIPDLSPDDPLAVYVDVVFPPPFGQLLPGRGRPKKASQTMRKKMCDLPPETARALGKIPTLSPTQREQLKERLGIDTLAKLHQNIPLAATPLSEIPVDPEVKRVFLFIESVAIGRFQDFDPDMTHTTAYDFKRAAKSVHILASRKPEGERNALAVFEEADQLARTSIFRLLIEATQPAPAIPAAGKNIVPENNETQNGNGVVDTEAKPITIFRNSLREY